MRAGEYSSRTLRWLPALALSKQYLMLALVEGEEQGPQGGNHVEPRRDRHADGEAPATARIVKPAAIRKTSMITTCLRPNE